MKLERSKAPVVSYEFANSAQREDVAGVHISMAPIGGGPPINVFLPIESAVKLLIGLRHSLKHAMLEASAGARREIESIVKHEDAMDSMLGKPPDTGKLLGLDLKGAGEEEARI